MASGIAAGDGDRPSDPARVADGGSELRQAAAHPAGRRRRRTPSVPDDPAAPTARGGSRKRPHSRLADGATGTSARRSQLADGDGAARHRRPAAEFDLRSASVRIGLNSVVTRRSHHEKATLHLRRRPAAHARHRGRRHVDVRSRARRERAGFTGADALRRRSRSSPETIAMWKATAARPTTSRRKRRSESPSAGPRARLHVARSRCQSHCARAVVGARRQTPRSVR